MADGFMDEPESTYYGRTTARSATAPIAGPSPAPAPKTTQKTTGYTPTTTYAGPVQPQPLDPWLGDAERAQANIQMFADNEARRQWVFAHQHDIQSIFQTWEAKPLSFDDLMDMARGVSDNAGALWNTFNMYNEFEPWRILFRNTFGVDPSREEIRGLIKVYGTPTMYNQFLDRRQTIAQNKIEVNALYSRYYGAELSDVDLDDMYRGTDRGNRIQTRVAQAQRWEKYRPSFLELYGKEPNAADMYNIEQKFSPETFEQTNKFAQVYKNYYGVEEFNKRMEEIILGGR